MRNDLFFFLPEHLFFVHKQIPTVLTEIRIWSKEYTQLSLFIFSVLRVIQNPLEWHALVDREMC